jgi:hypothetical protein
VNISSSRERLRLLGGDRCVASNQLGHDTTEGLDTKGKRGNVQQENVANAARQNGTLDGRTNRHSLIGVDALVWFATKDSLDRLNHLGHPRQTTDKDNLLDIARCQSGIAEGLFARIDGTLNEGVDEGLELGTEELEVDVFGARGVHSDEGEVDLGLSGGRKLNLGLLSGFTNTLDGHSIAREVDTSILLEFGKDVLDEGDVEVLTTKVSVSVGRLDFKDAALELEDRDIEGSTTQVVDGHNVFARLVHTVRKGSSSGLVDDTEYVETGNLSGVLGRLPLSVVEVGWDGDEGVINLLFDG